MEQESRLGREGVAESKECCKEGAERMLRDALRGLQKGDLTMSFPFVSQTHSEHLLEKKTRKLCLCVRSSI